MSVIKDQSNQESIWQYTVIWYGKERDLLTKEEEKKAIREYIITLGDEQHFKVEEVEVTPQYIKMSIKVRGQINSSKVMKQFQKKLTTYIKKSIGSLPEEVELWDEQRTLMMSKQIEGSRQNKRLEKILQAVIDAEYYDLEDGFTSQLEDLKRYILEQKISLVEEGERLFLVDEEALKKEINLNCFECTKLYQYGCCCGSPCNLGSRNRKNFDKHLINIEEAVRAYDQGTYEKILSKGGFIASDGSINACDGHCALLVEEEGVYKCIAHSYALKRDIPVYSICPLSCLMYPLEIIELITNKQRKVLLLTSVVDETFAHKLGRWGSYNTLEVELRCIDKQKHNAIFREEDYKPVYQVSKGLLCHEFGELFYSGLVKVLEED